jgi:hypothetical protein
MKGIINQVGVGFDLNQLYPLVIRNFLTFYFINYIETIRIKER